MPSLFNPASSQIGSANVLLLGKAKHYEARFASPISIKTVLSGSAVWETQEGRFEITRGCALVLRDGEEYTLTVDALQPVETLCIFFSRGFVEEAFAAVRHGSEELLAGDRRMTIDIPERLHFGGAVVEAMRRVEVEGMGDAQLFTAAGALARAQSHLAERIARLPALRLSTRRELARRIGIATSFLHANLGRHTTIGDAAAAACLSPFHLHRLFAAFHGITPHRYLTSLRLQRARAMLRHTDLPVADVASACGFESLGSFTTLFSRALGVSPARFRKIREEGIGLAEYDRLHERIHRRNP